MVTEDPWIFWKSSLWEYYDGLQCRFENKHKHTHIPQPNNNIKSSKLLNYFWSTTAGWTRYAQFSYQFYFFQGIQGTAVWTANWVLPPTNGYLKPRDSLTPQRRGGVERSLFLPVSHSTKPNTGYIWLYPQFKRWISVRLGRILVSIAWETMGHFSWARLNHPTLNWPENWGSVHFFPLLWNLCFLSNTVQNKFV